MANQTKNFACCTVSNENIFIRHAIHKKYFVPLQRSFGICSPFPSNVRKKKIGEGYIDAAAVIYVRYLCGVVVTYTLFTFIDSNNERIFL